MYAILLFKNTNKLLAKIMSKHTLNGRRRKAIKTSGFRARIKTKAGRNILQNRRRKGRWKLSI
jgi:large subunit ribosomal protein L34